MISEIRSVDESLEIHPARRASRAALPPWSLVVPPANVPPPIPLPVIESRPAAAVTNLFRKQKMEGPLVLPGATLHMLPETHENVSATQIRAAVERGGALKRLVPDAVAEYIHKEQLYRNAARRKRSE